MDPRSGNKIPPLSLWFSSSKGEGRLANTGLVVPPRANFGYLWVEGKLHLRLVVKDRQLHVCLLPLWYPRLRRLSFLTLSLALALLTVGCKKDPKKFLEQGNASFSEGKYSEALIYYRRALQADPRFAEAHYRMGLTQMKLGNWPAAYQELSRVVDLQPDHWKAQLDLGQLELASSKRQ